MSDRRGTTALVALVVAAAATAMPAGANAQSARWDDSWRRADPMVVGFTGTALAYGTALNLWWPHPEDANWSGPILFDEAIGSALRPDEASAARTASVFSDVFATTNLALPLVDSVAVAGLGRRAPVTALQGTAMHVEAFGTALFSSTILKLAVARERPPTDDCESREDFDRYCSHERHVSFPSGHTTLAFTGASLTCALHEHVPLYGSRVADLSACWGSMATATATGVTRIISGNHYPSDVLAGAAIGVGAGYFLPKALHFGFGDERSTRESGLRPSRKQRSPLLFSYSRRF